MGSAVTSPEAYRSSYLEWFLEVVVSLLMELVDGVADEVVTADVQHEAGVHRVDGRLAEQARQVTPRHLIHRHLVPTQVYNRPFACSR